MNNSDLYSKCHSMFKYVDGYLFRINDLGRFKAGNEVGNVDRYGYLQTKMKGKVYKVHRIIYLMHHRILPDFIDHADGDKLNNLIDNMRGATKRQNSHNRVKRVNCSSIYKGVCLDKRNGRWYAKIVVDGVSKSLGYHVNEVDAGKAYNAGAMMYFGEFARINTLTPP